MKDFTCGFPASAFFRSLLGLLFTCAAVTLVLAVEHAGQATRIVPTPTTGSATVTHSMRLTIESTYPVQTWCVQRLGVDQIPADADVWSWHGQVSLATADELFIQARSAAQASAPHRSLRIRLGTLPEQVVWGNNDVATTVVVP